MWPAGMTTLARKGLKLAIRLVLVSAALAYIVYMVDWQNTTLLADGKTKTAVYAVEPPQEFADPVRVLVERDGQRVWVNAGEFRRPRTRIEGQKLPLVTPGLKKVVSEIRWLFVIYGLFIFSPVYVILAWRLRLLLATQSVFLKAIDAIKVSYASAFVNFAIPTGTIGGDGYKAWYVAKHAVGRRTEALTVVLLDRAVGLLNFIFMAAMACALSWRAGRVGNLGKLVLLACAGSLVFCMAFYSKRVRRLLRVEQWLPRLPFGHHLVRIDQTAYSMRLHPGPLFRSFAWTFVSQCYCCVCFMFLARATRMEVYASFEHTLEYFRAVIIGLTVASLPGNPPQGFGVLEGIIRYLLPESYGSFEQIFATCIGLRMMHLLWSLPGAAVWLIEPAPRGAAPVGEVEGAAAATPPPAAAAP